jgi:hypothetical protein
MMRPWLTAAIGLVIGCAPFAPPIRTMHGGAPGRLDPGDMEIGGGPAGLIAEGSSQPFMGGGGVGWAARPHLTVEGGIDGSDAWTLGWGGVRVPGRWAMRPGVQLAADGEIGVGAGVGGDGCKEYGTSDCEPDGLAWNERPAGGGYLGAGGALRLWPVSIYLRARGQIAAAKKVPTTHWASAFGGLHVHILRHADVWGGVAVVHYANGEHSIGGYTWEAGVAFRFDPRAGWNDR